MLRNFFVLPSLLVVIACIGIGCQTSSSPHTGEAPGTGEPQKNSTPINMEKLQPYLDSVITGFETIAADRKVLLEELSGFIKQQIDSGLTPRLTFICTHNSRRSHMGQIWAATAAAHYGVGPIECYSGGTEVTAFNPRAVAALERAGFTIEAVDSSSTNIRYAVALPGGKKLLCFSKKYNDLSNPDRGFAAVMTCSQADAECPFIPGASFRLSLPYIDPKEADNTPEETARYDERCRQIATEMMYVFSKVKG